MYEIKQITNRYQSSDITMFMVNNYENPNHPKVIEQREQFYENYRLQKYHNKYEELLSNITAVVPSVCEFYINIFCPIKAYVNMLNYIEYRNCVNVDSVIGFIDDLLSEKRALWPDCLKKREDLESLILNNPQLSSDDKQKIINHLRQLLRD